jgi:hypothetical protein
MLGQREQTIYLLREDLDAGVPENWLCVDCGVNTAPGFLTRAEAMAAFAAGKDRVGQRIDSDSEIYTVRAAVWKRAGLDAERLCSRCRRKS